LFFPSVDPDSPKSDCSSDRITTSAGQAQGSNLPSGASMSLSLRSDFLADYLRQNMHFSISGR
jgi:hypothetical protein